MDVCWFCSPGFSSPVVLGRAVFPCALGILSIPGLSSGAEPLTHTWAASAAHTLIQLCLKLVQLPLGYSVT